MLVNLSALGSSSSDCGLRDGVKMSVQQKLYTNRPLHTNVDNQPRHVCFFGFVLGFQVAAAAAWSFCSFVDNHWPAEKSVSMEEERGVFVIVLKYVVSDVATIFKKLYKTDNEYVSMSIF